MMEQPLSAQQWHDELKRYKREFKRWTDRGNDIVKRYRDERKDTQDNARFNIFWSNVQTLKPAIFSKVPMPEVSRRYNDADPVSRCASTILERALDYEIKQYDDFIQSISHVVDDRLLCGRGIAWLRYEPIIEQVRDFDLIYHEATYLDDQREKAELRYHSTAKQAAELARKANVKRLLLGHFSSQYEHLSPFEEEAKAVFPATENALQGVTYFI